LTPSQVRYQTALRPVQTIIHLENCVTGCHAAGPAPQSKGFENPGLWLTHLDRWSAKAINSQL